MSGIVFVRPEWVAMLTLPSPDQDLLEGYRLNGHVVLPGFVDKGLAAEILSSTFQLPGRRVACGIPGVTWSERTIPPAHTAHVFVTQPAVLALVGKLAGDGALGEVHAWTSTYELHEFINPHRDGDGLVQMLLCLHSPRARGYGGELVLDGQVVFLDRGDAVIFDATAVEHYTTPLRSAPNDPHPSRVVLVARYYRTDERPH